MKAPGDVFKFLVLSDKQPKIQIHYDESTLKPVAASSLTNHFSSYRAISSTVPISGLRVGCNGDHQCDLQVTERVFNKRRISPVRNAEVFFGEFKLGH